MTDADDIKSICIPKDGKFVTADSTTNAYVAVAKCVTDYCDAAEGMIRDQYECAVHNIAATIANCVIAQQKSRALPRLDG